MKAEELMTSKVFKRKSKVFVVSEMPIKTTAGIKSDLKYEHQEKICC